MTELEQTLQSKLSRITGLDAGAMEKARARQAELAKPPGSLGLLEDLSVQLAGITGQVKNELSKTRIYVLAADNGVVDEGVSSAPQTVTLAQSINLTRGLTGASCLAKHFGDELVVVDMGIKLPYHCPEIVNRSLGKGTKNLYREPAMTREQAVRGILTGIELAAQAKHDGVSILGVGEMGIGNTTTSSAVLSALTGASVEGVTGRGGGLTDAAFLKKKHVIEHALSLHAPDKNDPIDVLSKVGGFEIGGIAGAILGAAKLRKPVVIDGFISTAGALIAHALVPESAEYMILAHSSVERGHVRMAEILGKKALLNLDLRLGEGTGAALAMPLLDAASAIMREMSTFSSAGVTEEGL